MWASLPVASQSISSCVVDPVNRGFDAAVRVQAEMAVAGREVVDGEIFTTGPELNTAGRCRHPFDTVDTLMCLLVYMAPQHGLDISL